MGRIAETGKLTPREVMFLRIYIKGGTLDNAYREVTKNRPDGKILEDESYRKMGSRMLQRIKSKVDWPRLMESAGLGEMRLLRELDARLGANTTHFWQDKVVSDVEDNATRMRATELLADLNGKRKLEISGPGGGPIPVQIIDDIPASTAE